MICLARLVVAQHHVEHAVRQADLVAHLGEQHRGRGRVLGGLEHHGVAHCNRRRNFPRQHQQREVPGDDLPANAQRFAIWQFAVHQLRHARVVVEMAVDQRDIDVAAFADRFAVVERLQHTEKTGMFLHQAGEGVEVFGALMARETRPFRLCAAGGGDGGVDVVLRGLGERGEGLAGGGVARDETVAGRGHLAVDEMAIAIAAIDEPGQRFGGGFRGGAVVEAFEDLGDVHLGSPLDVKRGLTRRAFEPRES